MKLPINKEQEIFKINRNKNGEFAIVSCNICNTILKTEKKYNKKENKDVILADTNIQNHINTTLHTNSAKKFNNLAQYRENIRKQGLEIDKFERDLVKPHHYAIIESENSIPKIKCLICDEILTLSQPYSYQPTMNEVSQDDVLKTHANSKKHISKFVSTKINTEDKVLFENESVMLRISATPLYLQALDSGDESIDATIRTLTSILKRGLQGSHYKYIYELNTPITEKLSKYLINLDKSVMTEDLLTGKKDEDDVTTYRTILDELRVDNALAYSNVKTNVYADGKFRSTRLWYGNDTLTHNSFYIFISGASVGIEFKSKILMMIEDLEYEGYKVEMMEKPITTFKQIALGIYRDDSYKGATSFDYSEGYNKPKHIYRVYNKELEQWEDRVEYIRLLRVKSIETKDHPLTYEWLSNLYFNNAYEYAKILISGYNLNKVELEREYIGSLKYRIDMELGRAKHVSKKDMKRLAKQGKDAQYGINNESYVDGMIEQISNLTSIDNTMVQGRIDILIRAESPDTLSRREREIGRILGEYDIKLITPAISGNKTQKEKIEEALNITKINDFTYNLDMRLDILAAGYPFGRSMIDEPYGVIYGRSLTTNAPIIVNNWAFSSETGINKDLASDMEKAGVKSHINKISDYPKNKSNGNTIIIAKSGHGKSTLLSNIMMQDLITHRKVIILDVEGEYVNRAHKLNQTVFDFSSEPTKYEGRVLAKSGINPLEIFNWTDNPTDEEIIQKVQNHMSFIKDFLITLEPKFIREVNGQNAKDLSMILEDIQRLYNNNIKRYIKREILWPTIEDIWLNKSSFIRDKISPEMLIRDRHTKYMEALKKERELYPIYYSFLIDSMKKGSYNHTTFSSQTSLESGREEDLIVLNTKGHELSGQNTNSSIEALYFMLINWVNSRVLSGRYNDKYLDGTPKSMRFVLDEAHKYLKASNPRFKAFIENMFKVARKRNVGITISTQDLTDITNGTPTTIFNNTETFLIGFMSSNLDNILNEIKDNLADITPSVVKQAYIQSIQNSDESASKKGNFLIIRDGKTDVFASIIPHYLDEYTNRHYKNNEKYGDIFENVSLSGEGRDTDFKIVTKLTYLFELIMEYIIVNNASDYKPWDVREFLATNPTLSEITNKFIPDNLKAKFLNDFTSIRKNESNTKVIDEILNTAGYNTIKDWNDTIKHEYYFKKIIE